MKKPILTAAMVAMFVAGMTAAVAFAGNGGGGGSYENCTPTHYGKHHKCHPKPTTPGATTAPTTTTTPTTTSTVPPVNPQQPVKAFCVQTVERGETFVQANPDSFSPGGDWYALVTSGATVVLDGHTVTLQWEDGKGVIAAPDVPGVGLTCDAPWVTTDGVVTV